MSSSPPITEDSPTTLTPNGTTEVPGIKKYLNKEMFFSLCVVATAGGIVLTGLMGICLYGCTRRPKDERIWIEKKRKEGVPLPVAGSDASGEEDTLLYATINFVQSTSQPPGNSEESKQTKVELNPYYTVLKQPVSSDSEHIYSLVTAH